MDTYQHLLSPANVKQVRETIQALPKTFSLEDATRKLSGASTATSRQDTASLALACLIRQWELEHRHAEGGVEQSNPDNQDDDKDDDDQSDPLARQCPEEATQRLVQVVVAKLLHLGPHASTTRPTTTDSKLHSLAAELGLFLLEQASLIAGNPDQLDHSDLLTIVAYTDSGDPWTTDKAASMASRILSCHLPVGKLADFVTGPLLHGYLRPIFSNSSGKVTSSGRPAQYNNQSQHGRPTLEPPSWKQHGLQTVTVFYWAVRVADAALLASNWPLFVPVLVALAEDADASVRERGLDILVLFLGTCPSSVLRLTGIVTVFEGAVFPTLMFLPSLTPEQDSIRLLRVSYRALLLLADANPERRDERRRRLLDRALRDGVMAGYHHASQHIRLVQVLMDATAAIASSLGTSCTKHLQILLPMLSAVMTDPFAMAHPPTLIAATKALNVVLTNCWYCFSQGEHVEYVAHAIAICWLNLYEDDASDTRLSTDNLQLISTQLKKTSSLLQSVWAKQGQEPPENVVQGLRSEPRFAKLFPALHAE